MAIRLDRSRSGIVIHCEQCAHWSAFRFDEEEAWNCAVDHEERVHSGEVQAHKAAHTAATRRAVRSM